MCAMLFLMLLYCVLKVHSAPPGGYYHPKYDYLNIDDVLNHKRLVYHYTNCLLSRAPCTPQGMELKEILPEALETTCLRCTDKQKAVVLHIIQRLRKEYPDVWKELSDLWDPTGENLRKFIITFGGAQSEILSSDNDIASNLLGNRFGNDDDSSNDIAGSLKPATTTTTTTVKPTKPKLKPKTDVTPSATATPSFPSITAAPAPPVFWWVNNNGASIPPLRWRPTRVVFRPRPSWLGDVSSKVIQAGGQVAEMVLSTVQAALTG